jgi:hypothetical protein
MDSASTSWAVGKRQPHHPDDAIAERATRAWLMSTAATSAVAPMRRCLATSTSAVANAAAA